MVGHMITRYLLSLKKYSIINASLEKLNDDTIILNVEDNNKLRNTLSEKKPTIVINCVGLLIRDSAEHPARAIYLNSFIPHYLAELGKEMHFKTIHLSTDCVFSGKNGGYNENDVKDGEDHYARTKALGEIINERDLTFRTSIIGPDLNRNGTGLFQWFMTQTEMIYGYTNVFWTGVTSLELAKVVHEAINQDISGLYHLVPSKRISKYELLMLIKEIWGKSIEINKNSQQQSDKSLKNTRKDFRYEVSDYHIMLRELFEWMKDWEYPHYNINVQ